MPTDDSGAEIGMIDCGIGKRCAGILRRGVCIDGLSPVVATVRAVVRAFLRAEHDSISGGRTRGHNPAYETMKFFRVRRSCRTWHQLGFAMIIASS